jgi:hypothetical protein
MLSDGQVDSDGNGSMKANNCIDLSVDERWRFGAYTFSSGS